MIKLLKYVKRDCPDLRLLKSNTCTIISIIFGAMMRKNHCLLLFCEARYLYCCSHEKLRSLLLNLKIGNKKLVKSDQIKRSWNRTLTLFSWKQKLYNSFFILAFDIDQKSLRFKSLCISFGLRGISPCQVDFYLIGSLLVVSCHAAKMQL